MNVQLVINVIERDSAFIVVQIHSYMSQPHTQVKGCVGSTMDYIVSAPLPDGEEAILLFQSGPPHSGYRFLGNTHIPVSSQAHLNFPVVTSRDEAFRP